ncbi:hypothetical protein N7541_001174 [Penicillium brevicompactum]|uniref:Uncharacterized protein n=1 Tax=Penicillium brevicompactum TaxID=5074 RepID=A0A9W9RVL7_PENBR|nr:uncharacterized protein N7506_001157 [Penicillium brevicompactum]KAJ5347904.1 hypothetical protein N7506_001157 [Penicillium brevicompactum]KAJ5367233.1 hypothetical protein N7541_001174 [Penicillium brevicompactum]
MKLSFQAATIISLLLAGASAEKSGMFMANGMELEMHQFGEDIIYTEPGRSLEGRDTNKCTSCVGHHGSCVVGDGNCYAPDECGFCGGCSVREARCQNPKKEGCVCYK